MAFQVPGAVQLHFGRHVLVYGQEAQALGDPVFDGPVWLHAGYKLWEAPEYFLPRLIIDDIGQEFDAPQSLTWIEERGDLFPRSEAYGQRASGVEEGHVLKALDLTDMRVFASASSHSGPYRHLTLAIEAEPVPDRYAVVPAPCPVPLLARGLPTYRLAPGVFGAVGAVILSRLLELRRRDFRLTFDELDDMLAD